VWVDDYSPIVAELTSQVASRGEENCCHFVWKIYEANSLYTAELQINTPSSRYCLKHRELHRPIKVFTNSEFRLFTIIPLINRS